MSDLIKNLTEETFPLEISKGIVLIDFFASWCGPCRMLAPILEQLAEFYKNKILIAKIDIDVEQFIASTYQVASIPTMIIFKNGKEINRLVGLRDLETLKDAIESAFKNK